LSPIENALQVLSDLRYQSLAKSNNPDKNRFFGAMLGLVYGDAVMSFQLEAEFHGRWTADTSLSLCLMASLIESRHFDPKDDLQQNKPERVDAFKAGAAKYVKKVLEKFDDFSFYLGENCDVEGMVILMGYREDGTTPYCVFWIDGILFKVPVLGLCGYSTAGSSSTDVCWQCWQSNANSCCCRQWGPDLCTS
jgi:hypothetical protein